MQVNYQQVIRRAKLFIENELEIFKNETKKSATQTTDPKFVQLVDAEKNLKNILGCFEADFTKFIERFKKVAESDIIMTSEEVQYLTLITEFSSLMDLVELAYSQPVQISNSENTEYYTQQLNQIDEQLKKSEDILEQLSSLSHCIDQSNVSIKVPIEYKEMEKQFVNVSKVYDEYKVLVNW